MAAPTPEQLQGFITLANGHASVRQSIRVGLLAVVERLWRSLTDKRSPAQVDLYIESVVAATDRARRREAQAVTVYLQRQAQFLGRPELIPRDPPSLPQRPRGIDPADAAERPIKQYRFDVVRGVDQALAELRALQRAQTIAEDDLALAMRQAIRGLLVTDEGDIAPIEREIEDEEEEFTGVAFADERVGEDEADEDLTEDDLVGPEDEEDGADEDAPDDEDQPGIIGYRRLIHPELSESGTCGLCIAAADRIYKTSQLMDIHEHCKCTVGLIISGQPDVGNGLNRAQLRELYSLAGGTGKTKLAKVRYRRNRHGELGPVLGFARHEFRGPEDVAELLETPVPEGAVAS